LRTQISNSTTFTGSFLQIQRQQGSWVPPARPIWTTVHNVNAPSGVLLNGTALPQAAAEANLASMTQGWFYNSTNNRLIVLVQDAASQNISIQN
jgi:hypothetical protein